MNTEIDLQKIMKLVLKKWKLVAIFCLIGALLIGIYSANFATKTYSSSVKFFVYAVETWNNKGGISPVGENFIEIIKLLIFSLTGYLFGTNSNNKEQ